MVALLLSALVAVQQATVSATVNRDEVVVGEDLVLTIVAHTVGDEPVEIVNPDLTRLEVIGVRGGSRVTIRAGAPVRETTRELTLRALAAGTAIIGAVRLRQGAVTVQTVPIRVTVTTPDAGAGTLAPHVRSLLAQAPPPGLGPEEVGLTVYPSPGIVVLGEQVDLIVVAWFPRDVRDRLAAPPTLSPPPVRGAWSYRRATPSRPALSRRIRGAWYDLYVLHDVVFPVTAGALEIGAASVSYTVPLTYSGGSRELRHEVRSPPVSVAVRPQPTAGRPAGFGGTAGTGLRLRVEASSRELPLGGAATVRADLRGIGNVALWAEPAFAWPVGIRVYPEAVEERVLTENGFIGGVKVFHYLVVADSLGTHRVPRPAYPYFDVRSGRYVTVDAAPLEFVTAGARGAVFRASPPVLLAAPRRPPLTALAAAVPPWGWLVVALGPMLLAALTHLLRRRASRRAVGRPRRRLADAPPLERLDWELRDLLEGLVPDAATRDGVALGVALRASGVEAPVAAHAARVRERLQQAIYGPDGATDPDELAAEARAVIDTLGTHLRPAHRPVAGAVAGIVLVVAASTAMAQSPERLYQAGAAQLAADSFALRVAAEPAVAAHWYNLGSARYGLGDLPAARVAWLRAARLSPREPGIRRVLGLVPPPDRETSELTWVAPVTPVEAGAAAAALWILGWLVVAARRRPGRLGIGLVAAAVVAGGYAASVAYRYRQPVALTAVTTAPLRAAPYGSAPAAAALEEGAAVLVVQQRGAWRLVRRGAQRGWMLASEIVRL